MNVEPVLEKLADTVERLCSRVDNITVELHSQAQRIGELRGFAFGSLASLVAAFLSASLLVWFK